MKPEAREPPCQADGGRNIRGKRDHESILYLAMFLGDA
jgi:hypothetical protein